MGRELNIRKSWLVAAFFAGSFAIAGPGNAAPIVDPATGRAYELVLTPDLNWHQAVDAAAQMSWAGRQGHLATITTLAEQTFVVANLGGGPQINCCWVGGYQDRSAANFSEPFGGWKWITGETWLDSGPEAPTFSFNNTFSDYTSEEYLITWWGTGGLNDFSESGYLDSRGFIVEYDPTATAVSGPELGSAPVLLGSPSPNPANGALNVAFDLPSAGHVRVQVFDMAGRLVATLIDETASAGARVLHWDARGEEGRTLASGAYCIRLETRGRMESRTVLILK
jgi:hypothetical protein